MVLRTGQSLLPAFDESLQCNSRYLYNRANRKEVPDMMSIVAYQIRQSFKPRGEITAEEANKVGYELAMRFTKRANTLFIVATPQTVTTSINLRFSTPLDGSKKFRIFFRHWPFSG